MLFYKGPIFFRGFVKSMLPFKTAKAASEMAAPKLSKAEQNIAFFHRGRKGMSRFKRVIFLLM